MHPIVFPLLTSTQPLCLLSAYMTLDLRCILLLLVLYYLWLKWASETGKPPEEINNTYGEDKVGLARWLKETSLFMDVISLHGE